ncbi:NAD(P)H-binding protein [uncultured Cohaesibacter sp.]|uniref:NAD(P)H-binding protein n=1 Tax=uncultured Cohaesibacter sp. TaxID=1002546 RepID=UPI0029C6730D|nr:NAD(P)H-binding protein [uncultured Cohaesibacter sp.]
MNGKKALVLGASGGVGGAVASALLRHGWVVLGMARKVPATSRDDLAALEWVVGDALVLEDVVAAAKGVDVIVHAVNPAGYRNWDRLVMPMIRNSIAAAKANGCARLVLPGTIYNFDPATNPVIDETSPQNARSRKGRIRAELEQALKDASSEVPVLIVRAGDFFGPGTRSSWFAEAMVAKGKRLRRIINPAKGAGHSWAYLPDLGETFAQLFDREDQLKPFEVVHFEGLYDESGNEMTEAIMEAVGRSLPVWRMPWWLFRVLAPFGGFPREVAEIIPHWTHPLRLNNRRLLELLGSEPRTDRQEAVKAALADLGCS